MLRATLFFERKHFFLQDVARRSRAFPADSGARWTSAFPPPCETRLFNDRARIRKEERVEREREREEAARPFVWRDAHVTVPSETVARQRKEEAG